MAKLTGKNLYVEYDGNSLTGTQRAFEVSESQETADTTAGADDYRNFANTVKTISATMEIVMVDHGGNGSALLAALVLGGTGTLQWGAEGSATGMPKKAFMARLIDASQPMPFDDTYVINLEWAMAGTALIFDGITDLWP